MRKIKQKILKQLKEFFFQDLVFCETEAKHKANKTEEI